jgi:hypothetical protein
MNASILPLFRQHLSLITTLAGAAARVHWCTGALVHW